MEQDALIVDVELGKYQAAGVISNDEELADFDILVFWQVCPLILLNSCYTYIYVRQAHKYTFPLLYRVALDVLPVQAYAVPCERVFSSGKETDAARRSNLSPDMMESLQILKYLFREERLSFENDWMDTEQDMLAAESRIVTINENQ